LVTDSSGNTFSFRIDGNSYLNGNVSITGTTSFNSNLPTSTLTPTTSTQLITKSYGDSTYATQSSLSTTNSNVSTNTTNITSLQTLLTGASYNSTYNYLDLANNLHVYGSLQLAGLSTDLSSTIANIYTSIGSILSNNNSWTGTNAFNSYLPTSTLTPSSSTQLITKAYADASYTASGGTTLSAIQSNNNTWTGTNTFNNNLSMYLSGSSNTYPTLQISCDGNGTLASCIINLDTWNGRTLGATQIIAYDNGNYSSDLVFRTSTPGAVNASSERMRIMANGNIGINKSSPSYLFDINGSLNALSYYLNGVALSNIGNTQYLDISSSLTTQLAGKTTLSAIQSNNNIWIGSNTFNTSLPTSTLTPSSSSQLITKAYADATYTASGGTTLSAVQSNNNTWIGTNAFNTSLPTSTLTPSTSTQLVTKTYVDTQVATKQASLSSTSTNAISCLSVTTPTISLNGSDLTTTLSGKQPTITSSTNLSTGTISCTSLTCNSLNVQKGAITSDNSSMWLYNSTNGYGVNFALFQSATGNTVLNSSSGQTMDFKINNNTYMQMYSNGVVNIGVNQVFNKQLVLYDSGSSDTPSTATAFYGFGVNSSTLRYQVDSTGSAHKFYGGSANFATISNSGININNGNLTLSTNAPSSSSQLGYNNYTTTSGTTTYTCTTTLQAYSSVASITLPNAGTYMIFCFNLIKPSATLTNASFQMQINLYTLSSCYQFYSSLPSGTYVTLNTNPITVNVTGSTTLTLYFTTQCSSGSANLTNNFNMQYTRIG
jgi:hypothetical protein